MKAGLCRYQAQWLTDLEIPLANKFYRTHGFRGKAKRFEHCAVVRFEQSELVACGYIRGCGNYRLLSGVAVAPAHQNMGVARRLLKLLSQKFDEKTYVFPYAYLHAFYESLGFYIVNSNDVTCEVQQRYLRFRDQGRNIIIMAYRSE
ncbi:GNAT family N-acetyltransferase [uncultured Shewanella sp.]|uniref:GNAT family N-acetyltransferase n=1 Tax=uncultured Shewanella sp. TaxID=173975 RepID=UPI002610D02F|nr:GNAT family N-acetyltransferase [uncultured Shewanella sp.]